MNEDIKAVCGGTAELIVKELGDTRSLFQEMEGKYSFKAKAVQPVPGGDYNFDVKDDFGWRIDPVELEETGKEVKKWHKGIDIQAAEGTDVKSVIDGTVVGVVKNLSPDNKSGKVVRINGSDGREYQYWHLSEINVENGKVKAGQIIGKVGQTGSATGPHLHLGIKDKPTSKGGKFIDPQKVFGEKLKRLPSKVKEVQLYKSLNSEDQKKLKTQLEKLAVAYRKMAECARLMAEMCRKAPPQAGLGPAVGMYERTAQIMDKTADGWDVWAEHIEEGGVELFYWLNEHPEILTHGPEVPPIQEKPEPEIKKAISLFDVGKCIQYIQDYLADLCKRVHNWLSNIYQRFLCSKGGKNKQN